MTQMVLIDLDVIRHVFQLHVIAQADMSFSVVRRPQLAKLLMSIPPVGYPSVLLHGGLAATLGLWRVSSARASSGQKRNENRSER